MSDVLTTFRTMLRDLAAEVTAEGALLDLAAAVGPQRQCGGEHSLLAAARRLSRLERPCPRHDLAALHVAERGFAEELLAALARLDRAPARDRRRVGRSRRAA